MGQKTIHDRIVFVECVTVFAPMIVALQLVTFFSFFRGGPHPILEFPILVAAALAVGYMYGGIPAILVSVALAWRRRISLAEVLVFALAPALLSLLFGGDERVAVAGVLLMLIPGAIIPIALAQHWDAFTPPR